MKNEGLSTYFLISVPTEKNDTNATKNHVFDIEVLHGQKAIRKIEPNLKGVNAIYSPQTAVYFFPLDRKFNFLFKVT